MIRSELFELYNKLQGLRQHSDKPKFSYAIIKNTKAIESEIKSLNEIINPTEGFLQFEEERLDMCKIHTTKDENGEPILNGDEYQIEDMVKFNEDLKPLKEKYNDTLIERQTQIESYNSKLGEEIVIDLVNIGPDDLPDAITPNEIEDIYSILL
jgi:hypothetical protein